MDDLLAGFWGLMPGASDQVRFVVNLAIAWTVGAGGLILLNYALNWARQVATARVSPTRHSTEMAAIRQVIQSYANRPHSDGLPALLPETPLRQRDAAGSVGSSALPEPIPHSDETWRRSAAGAPLRTPVRGSERSPSTQSPIPKHRVATSAQKARKSSSVVR